LGCIPEPENTNIPNTRVNFYIDVSLSGVDNHLADGLLGNSKIYTKSNPSQLSPNGSYGYSGVAVVRAYDNYLYAFDICCTYEADRNVVLNDDGFFLECPKCHSSFEIGNGTGYVNKGPATQRLKKYFTTQNSGQKIRIYN
jgi:nitrite reductase/ring-hydroxylating ferredoxin subunit